MIEVSFAQLRFAASLMFGTRFSVKSLEKMVESLKETRREFGSVSASGKELLAGPELDEEVRQKVSFRRFRSQAIHASRETAYYSELFRQLEIDPTRLRLEDLEKIPLTTKQTLRDRPDDFISRAAEPYLRSMTTGTTGWPTSVCFSEYELKTAALLGAIGHLTRGDLDPTDIVQINTSSRSTLGTPAIIRSCAYVGAQVYLAGVIEPENSLALLAQSRNVPGKKSRTSVLHAYPSYLGQLIETGRKLGYRASDFGLERIYTGGELVSIGLKARAQEFFGPVKILEGFGMTEVWPFGAQLCEEGHLHFEISQGLLEIINPDTGKAAQPGEFGTMVITPFRPYRETTLLLRYDTGDAVRTLTEKPRCSMTQLPATSELLGKLKLAVKHENGYTFPRQIMEALEELPEIILPARFGFQARSGGVAVEVVAPPEARAAIEQNLRKHEVPITELRLVSHAGQLQNPFPLRCDLAEISFQSQANGSDETLMALVS